MKPINKACASPRRSRKSVLEQRQLQRSLAEIESLQSYAEKRIAALQENKERQITSTNLRSLVSDRALSEILREMEDKKLKVAAYTERAEALRSQIGSLCYAGAKELAKGRKQRRQLARLAGQRLELDRKIEAALPGLRRLLEERASLTDEMRPLAASIDLSVDLDRTRFDDLLSSLPETVLPASERWTAWFIGKQRKPYVVCVEELDMPETLVHHGLYKFGETAFLTDGEASELLRQDRVLTQKAFKQAVAEARRLGADVPELMRIRQQERERQAQEARQKAEAANAALTSPETREARSSLDAVAQSGELTAREHWRPTVARQAVPI